jgi:hypothetical protein
LTVGCKHDDEGVVYSDSTSAEINNINFIKFNIKYPESGNTKYVKFDNANYDGEKYDVFIISNNDYSYPYSSNKPNISDKLFRALIDNTLKSSDIRKVEINGEGGFIKIPERGVYCIAKSKEESMTSSTNEETKLYGISISELIK